MKNLVNTMHETTIQPIMDLGWTQIYATPVRAAQATDPTATIRTFFSELLTRLTIFQYHTRTGTIAVRPWYEIAPFQEEPEIVGYMHDTWIDSELPALTA